MTDSTNLINADELNNLKKEALKIYSENFENKTWYGRCIFLSWYCEVGTCKFCFRSTTKHKVRHIDSARRGIASILIEALLCKKLGWRIEFLTGGYGIFPFSEIIKIAKLTSKVYGEKIWVNLGAIKTNDLKELAPYIKGVVASIETIEPNLHKTICPDKEIAPYELMFREAEKFNLKKSATIVIGLGEKKEDFALLSKFIDENKLDRITFYALKPVKGTEFTEGPKTDDYLWWIAKTRINHPMVQIIAGTTARRYEEVGELMGCGANAFTKFPATKLFGSEKANVVEEKIKESGRKFISTITQLPKIDWDNEINLLNIEDNLKAEMKIKIKAYLTKMGKFEGDDFDE